MSINEGTDKEDVLHIYNGLLLTIKKSEMLSAATWMALEIIILSEVSQTKSNAVWYYLHVEFNFLNGISKLIYKIENQLTDF